VQEVLVLSNNKQMIRQGSLLAVSGILVSIIGFVYRVPMSNMLGEGGAGIYSVAYNIYNIALTVSSYSFPSGISKVISEQRAKGDTASVKKVFSSTMLLAALIGAFISLLVYLGRYVLEVIYAKDGLAITMTVVAPTLFVMALLGVFRGYYQGIGNMVPTAVSQVIEQIVNAVLSLVLISYCLNYFQDSDYVSAYGAAGSLGGTLAGAAAALLFVITAYLPARKRDRPASKAGIPQVHSSTSVTSVWKAVLLTTLPIAFAQLINQLCGTLDDILFSNIMVYRGLTQDVISALQGVYSSQYSLLIRIPMTIATALSTALLPSIASDYIRRKQADMEEKVNFMLKIVALFTVPSAVGMSVLAMPILKILFPSLTAYRNYAAVLLYVGTSAIIFYSLSTLTSTIMQTVRLRRKMLKNSIISLVLHVICVALLLFVTNLGIYALCIGNILFPLTICILNIIALKKETGLKLDLIGLYQKPIICAAVMGVLAFGVYYLMNYFGINLTVTLVASVLLAVISYMCMILKLRYLKKSELFDLPFGEAFYNLLKRR